MLASVVAPRTQPPSKSPRRRLQWSVRGLLLLTTFSAVAATLFLSPRVREREAIDWLEKKSRRLETELIGPRWLRGLIGDRYLQHVVWADLRFSDVTDADVSRLAPLRHLQTLELVDTQMTIDRVERMSNEWRNISVDVLLADMLYRTAEAECQRPFYEVVIECEAAARWKIAWADSRGGHSRQVAARRQFIDSLKRCADEWNRGGNLMTALERAMFEAALAEGGIGLAKLSQSESAAAAARRDGKAAGKALVRYLDEAVHAAINPFEFDTARALATRLLLTSHLAGEEAVGDADILAEESKQTEQLTRRIEALYRDEKRGGEAEKMALAKVDLALVRARLALSRAGVIEPHSMPSMANDASELREAAQAAYKAGTLTMVDVLVSHRRAAELETELARAQGDQTAADVVRDGWLKFLREQVQRVVFGNVGVGGYPGMESRTYLVLCNYALAQYDQMGTALFDQPVAVLTPRPAVAEFVEGDEMTDGQMDDSPNASDDDIEVFSSELLDVPEVSRDEIELLPREDPLD